MQIEGAQADVLAGRRCSQYVQSATCREFQLGVVAEHMLQIPFHCAKPDTATPGSGGHRQQVVTNTQPACRSACLSCRHHGDVLPGGSPIAYGASTFTAT